MRTRNVVVTDSQAEMIDELVRCGRYQNASEVMREGLRLVGEREMKLKALREAVEIGISAIERGDYVEFTSGKALSNHLKKIAEQAIGASRRR